MNTQAPLTDYVREYPLLPIRFVPTDTPLVLKEMRYLLLEAPPSGFLLLSGEAEAGIGAALHTNDRNTSKDMLFAARSKLEIACEDSFDADNALHEISKCHGYMSENGPLVPIYSPRFVQDAFSVSQSLNITQLLHEKKEWDDLLHKSPSLLGTRAPYEKLCEALIQSYAQLAKYMTTHAHTGPSNEKGIALTLAAHYRSLAVRSMPLSVEKVFGITHSFAQDFTHPRVVI